MHVVVYEYEPTSSSSSSSVASFSRSSVAVEEGWKHRNNEAAKSMVLDWINY